MHTELKIASNKLDTFLFQVVLSILSDNRGFFEENYEISKHDRYLAEH